MDVIRPVSGGSSQIQPAPTMEDRVLEHVSKPVNSSDPAAAQEQFQRISDSIKTLTPEEAGQLLHRLTMRHPEDRFAREVHNKLGSSSLEKLKHELQNMCAGKTPLQQSQMQTPLPSIGKQSKIADKQFEGSLQQAELHRAFESQNAGVSPEGRESTRQEPAQAVGKSIIDAVKEGIAKGMKGPDKPQGSGGLFGDDNGVSDLSKKLGKDSAEMK